MALQTTHLPASSSCLSCLLHDCSSFVKLPSTHTMLQKAHGGFVAPTPAPAKHAAHSSLPPTQLNSNCIFNCAGSLLCRGHYTFHCLCFVTCNPVKPC